MSATETPASEPVETAPVETERRCPRCGASLRPEQEWCLQCGTGLGARVAAPARLAAAARRRRRPAGARRDRRRARDRRALGRRRDGDHAARPGGDGGADRGAPGRDDDARPVRDADADAVSRDADPGRRERPRRLAGRQDRLHDRARVLLDALGRQARGKELAGQGISVGILDSSGYRTLTPNRFVVFSGQYATRAEAKSALSGLKSRVAGAQVKRVAPN